MNLNISLFFISFKFLCIYNLEKLACQAPLDLRDCAKMHVTACCLEGVFCSLNLTLSLILFSSSVKLSLESAFMSFSHTRVIHLTP